MISIKNSKTKLSLTIFAISLFLRILVVVGYANGFFNGGLKGGDTHLYFEIANNLLNGNGFAVADGPTAFISPLYPIFLSVLITLFDSNLIFFSLVQSILSALVCVWIFYYTTELFESIQIGFIAGILAAVNYELILWSNAQLLTEPLYIFFFATAILFLVLALGKSSKTTFYFIASGLFFALASLTRPISIAIAIGLFLLLFFSLFFQKSISWKHPIYFLGIFLLLMMPWGLRNYLVMGSFTVSSLEGGHVFWLGNNPQYDTYNHPDFHKFGGYTAMMKPDEKLSNKLAHKSQVERNNIYGNAAWNHIKNHPISFLKRAIHKSWNMWRPNFSNSSWRNNLISYTFYPLLLLSALFGMFITVKRINTALFKNLDNPQILFIAILFIHILIHSVITGEIRFRVPLWTVLTPFSAYSLAILLKYFNIISKPIKSSY